MPVEEELLPFEKNSTIKADHKGGKQFAGHGQRYSKKF